MTRRTIAWMAPLAAAAGLAGCGGGVRTATTTVVRTTSAPLAASAASVNGALAYQQALVNVVKRLSPSVVQISTAQGLGSGIVFDTKGDIVTNAHVVGSARTFDVTTHSGKQLKGTLIGAFPADDLAVIRVPGSGLKPAVFANSSPPQLEVGDIAVAIGNPLGLKSSVTDGIVSAFRQGVPEGNGVVIPSMIQTSASINPGNSGGALADIQGRVIGIPTLAATDPQLGGSAAPGIGFAIPSNLVKNIAGQLIAHGKVVDSGRAYLGIEIGDTNGGGVYVGTVVAGSPAAKAGLKAGDIIVSVAGTSTPDTNVLGQVMVGLKPGQKVKVVVQTQSGARKTLQVTLGQYPG